MKQSEIKILSDSELMEQIEIKVAALADLRMAHAVSPLENPSQIKDVRRTVARLKTEWTKRQGN